MKQRADGGCGHGLSRLSESQDPHTTVAVDGQRIDRASGHRAWRRRAHGSVIQIKQESATGIDRCGHAYPLMLVPRGRSNGLGDGLSEIVLEPTHDFLVDLGQAKPAGQILVGFAAETSDLHENALDKLRRKRLDLIVGNDVSADAVGFEHDTNEVVLLDAEGGERHVPLTSKREVAAAVFDAVAQLRSKSK